MQLGTRPTVSSIVMEAIAAALMPVLVAGCGPVASPPMVGSFAGRLPASQAFIAIVTDGAEVRAYVCDGVSGRELNISEWFKGSSSGSSFELTSLSGNANLSV